MSVNNGKMKKSTLAAITFAKQAGDVNIAVIGIRSRGRDHYRALAKIPGVHIAVLCDIDRRLFPEAINEVEELTGYKPKTVNDYNEVLSDEDIDAVSIATPNHWHALQTIWACQAGKDVYVEKPVSHAAKAGACLRPRPRACHAESR